MAKISPSDQDKKLPRDYITPLNINGLQGRMLRLPAPTGKKREILFVYGHHSSLERWWGVVQDLNQYGAVTMPDLPGFGGMQSFYRIGKKPDIDTMADYLAAFVKMQYKRRKVTIAGLSFGFVIATRMLQKYPDLTKKVDMLVSVVGFTHYDEFTFSRARYRAYRYSAKFFSRRLPAVFFKNVLLHPTVLRLAYSHTHNAQNKFKGLSKAQRKANMDFEIYLWHCNEVRTYMATTVAFLTLDNCQAKVDLPVWHISVNADQYFDNNRVEQHLNVIFSKVHVAVAEMDTHAPSIIADMEEAAPMIPLQIRRALAKQP